VGDREPSPLFRLLLDNGDDHHLPLPDPQTGNFVVEVAIFHDRADQILVLRTVRWKNRDFVLADNRGLLQNVPNRHTLKFTLFCARPTTKIINAHYIGLDLKDISRVLLGPRNSINPTQE
jgi:hypothetical protein